MNSWSFITNILVMKLSVKSVFVSIKSNETHIVSRPKKIVAMFRLKDQMGWFEVPSNSIFDFSLKRYAFVSVLTLGLHDISYNRGFAKVSRQKRIRQILPLLGKRNFSKIFTYLTYLKAKNSISTETFYESCLESVGSKHFMNEIKMID